MPHIGGRTLSKVEPTTPGEPLDTLQMKKLVRKLEMDRASQIKSEKLLFLTRCSLTDKECEALGVAMTQLGPTQTEYLFFPTGHQEGGVGDLAAASVGEALARGMCPALGVIVLSEGQLTDRGMAALVKGAKRCPLRDLNLSKNLLADEGLAALVDVFLDGGCAELEKLDLSGDSCLKHAISDKSFVRFAKAMAEGEIKLLDLKELNLQDTMIGDEGVSWLATALRRGNLPRLENLYLMGCVDLTNKSAAALADAIRARKKMPLLNDVRLGYTQVTKEGKENIKQAARDKGQEISVTLELLNGEVSDKA